MDPIPGAEQTYYATSRALQYIGKLTYGVTPNHSLSLTVYGTPTFSGGDGDLGIDAQQDLPENQVLDMFGQMGTIRHRFSAFANDLSLKYSGAFDNKNWLLDVAFGWHYQNGGTRPSDGGQPGDKTGLASIPRVMFRRAIDADGNPYPHPITDFERLPDPTVCDPPAGSPLTTLCPVDDYQWGGPDFIDDATLNRYQIRGVVTRLLQGLGHHVIKGGVDLETMTYDHVKAYSGGRRFREGLDGSYYSDNRMFGFLSGPDQPVITDPTEARATSTTLGGFVQDSWAIMDVVTLNAGLRYDAQLLFGDDGKLGMSLPNEWSPRVGAIFDFTQKGRSKIFANFAMYYENVPLDLVDRSMPGERQIASFHDAATCDPRDPEQARGACQDPSNLLPVGTAADPNQSWIVTGGDRVPVDPDISPQSSSEFVAGAEYEVMPKGTLGLAYTRRWMNNVIEDMSRDEGQTYFIGNPGSGIASDFPEAERAYDGMSVYFEKKFAGDDLIHWLVSGSYTISYLRGNWAGLFRPETGQLDPNINSDFDLISALPNRSGPLPGDSRYTIKLFGATQFTPERFLIDLGVGWRSWSGGPTNYYGGHELYGDGEVFILPRGMGERLPWVHRLDTHLGFGRKLGKQNSMILTMDVFNLINFQEETSVDENYTYASVLPIVGGTPGDLGRVVHADGSALSPSEVNPNFGRATSYQAPRSFRFGLKATF
ncbi:MAG: TonB-dependent receptor [Deltaproteobacteria bacterium]|nr:TonB-dependent receptor [Deltaproteobacteria bacterium]